CPSTVRRPPRRARFKRLIKFIGFCSYNDIRYKTGIMTIHEDSNQFSIYDPEKTVIDILQYRERLGIEVAKEVLVQYLAKKDRNLNKLYRYAKELGNSKILRTYLEVLL
ncbi:hypothetical protein DS65_03760, partial [Mesotoga sp. SC_4PWL113PWK15]